MKTEVRTNKKTGRRKASYNTSSELDYQREKTTVAREMREREAERLRLSERHYTFLPTQEVWKSLENHETLWDGKRKHAYY